jgi:nicotinamide phosphoribosyltransferase
MTVENNAPEHYWLTNYLETLLSQIWSPSTVATASYYAKQMMLKYLNKTSDNPEAVIPFMLHDFGFRGVSSFESACTAGAGHLVNFMGTDTFPAVELTMDYYNAPEVTAYSVPATEHSIMTARGRGGEMEILGQLLDEYPEGILSVVIDSYDYREFITEASKRFKDKIEARRDILAPDGTVLAPGKTVFRPDSGAPSEVTMECATLLEEGFGATTNSKGYKVLNPKVGILWGDGIDIPGVRSILYTLEVRGFAASNMVFGMGGGLLQKINRDTQRFAFKSSYQERDGVGHDIFKQPIDRTKMSKRGKLMLVLTEDGGYKTVRQDTDVSNKGEDTLEDVFVDGELVRDMTFDEVRANAQQ